MPFLRKERLSIPQERRIPADRKRVLKRDPKREASLILMKKGTNPGKRKENPKEGGKTLRPRSQENT